MGRDPRPYFPGAIYHAMNHGVNDQDVFLDDQDRFNFLTTLERVRERTGAELLAYCLMNNHFHLAMKVDLVPLDAILQRLLTSYVSKFNLRHDRTGHLFQARSLGKICLDETYLATIVRYIHLNPVEHGFVEQPEDWRWSSVHAYRSGGRDKLVSLAKVLPLEAATVDSGFDPWASAGSASAAKPALMRAPSTEHLPLAAILAAIAREMKMEAGELKGGAFRGPAREARRELVRRAVAAGHSETEIASAVGVSLGAISQTLKSLKA